MLLPQAIVPLMIGVAHLALLGYLVIKQRLISTTANLLTAYLALTLAWNMIIFIRIQGWFPVFDTAGHLGHMFLLVISSLFIWRFTRQFLGSTASRVPGYIACGLTLSALAGFEVVEPAALQKFTQHFTIQSDVLIFWFSVGTSLLFLGHAIYIGLMLHRQTYSPRHRNRIQLLLLGLGCLAAGLMLYASGISPWLEIGLATQWLGMPILIYIVLNRNLPDINTGFKKVVNFIIVTLVTLAFFGLVLLGLQKVVDTPNMEAVVSVVVAVLLATVYVPLRKNVQRLVEQIVFRHQYNEERIIKDYIQAINNILLIHDLVSVSLKFIHKKLNIKRGAFFLLSHQDDTYYHFIILSNLNNELPQSIKLKRDTLLTQQLIDEGIPVAQYNLDLFPEFRDTDIDGLEGLRAMAFEQYVPVTRNQILIGILALGPFASKVPYSIRDIELFSTLAAQTAIALENARLFENVRQSLEEITQIKLLMDDVFASIKSGVITVNTSDEILLINEAVFSIIDPPRNIRPGANVHMLMSHLQDTSLPALYRDVKTSHQGYHGHEIACSIRNRGLVNLTVDLTPIKDIQGNVEGVAIVINDVTEKNRLQAVHEMFRTYLSPAVVDRLPSDPTQLKLGGQRQEVSILFADIRGFTTFSEQQQPEDLINILNNYFALATKEIVDLEGTLDKYMGDALMAIFNAPLAQKDHALRAVRAAAAMQQRLEAYHRDLGDDAPRLQFGVGIHVGEAVVGNVGTIARMDYTAIGDAVNLAKRIQENTPGGKILLSQSTYDLVKHQVNAIPYKKLAVKGRVEPEQSYELLNVLPHSVEMPVGSEMLVVG